MLYYGAAFKLLKQKYLKVKALFLSVLETSTHYEAFDAIQYHLVDHHFRTNMPNTVRTFTNDQIFTP